MLLPNLKDWHDMAVHTAKIRINCSIMDIDFIVCLHLLWANTVQLFINKNAILASRAVLGIVVF